MLACYRE
ncbi:uncharacterized protein FFMR_15421 [Fusarium fujikuroi]|nr:uncharacterized protein FFMR_15421 [Fusarium fujikuroi]